MHKCLENSPYCMFKWPQGIKQITSGTWKVWILHYVVFRGYKVSIYISIFFYYACKRPICQNKFVSSCLFTDASIERMLQWKNIYACVSQLLNKLVRQCFGSFHIHLHNENTLKFPIHDKCLVFFIVIEKHLETYSVTMMLLTLILSHIQQPLSIVTPHSPFAAACMKKGGTPDTSAPTYKDLESQCAESQD